jgi:hypothetical protein
VDTDGRLVMVNLTIDSTGAQAILDTILKRWPWIKHLFADTAYDRPTLFDKAAFLDLIVQIVRRIDNEPRLQSASLRVSRRTHVRLADPIAPSRPRLRAAARCLQGHDPRRYRKPPPAPHGPLVTILKRTLTAAHNSQRAVCPVQA